MLASDVMHDDEWWVFGDPDPDRPDDVDWVDNEPDMRRCLRCDSVIPVDMICTCRPYMAAKACDRHVANRVWEPCAVCGWDRSWHPRPD